MKNVILSTVAICLVAFAPWMNGQTPAPEGKDKPKAEEKKGEPKADEKKTEKKPVKPLESPCGGKLKAMHAFSQCGPDKVWHIVEDDYYDCPPVQKFRVYDRATEQPCDKPPPDPIKEGYQPFNGSGCQDYKDIGPMNIYECDEKTGFWYLNTYEVYVCDDGRRLVELKDRRETGKSCKDPHPELELPVIALNAPAQGKEEPNNSYVALVRDNKLQPTITGTGETIGHIADISLQNLTDQPITCTIPPLVLESVSGKNQDYACPKGETVSVPPHDSVKVPIDGVCVNRHKPPVGKDVGGDLVVNDGRHPDEHSHLTGRDADKLLRVCTSKYKAADKLQKDGQLKDLPYKDKEKQKEIVVQWSTWSDPQISEIIGGPPATKEDLKKVVYKQLEEKGPMTPETKKKVDQGIDTIFDKVELTTAKAKDLEDKPADHAGPSTVGTESPVGQTYEIAENTPTPEPGTQEKKKGKGKGGGKKKNKYLDQFDWWQKFVQKFPFRDWLQKKFRADWLDQVKDARTNDYNQKFKGFLDQKKVYTDLKSQRDAAEQKANGPGATQADKDAFNKLDNQLKKLENDFKQDFNKTDDGKQAMGDLHQAEKDANAAHDAEKDAGKNIDPSTKEAVDDYFKNNPPPPELLHPPDPLKAAW